MKPSSLKGSYTPFAETCLQTYHLKTPLDIDLRDMPQGIGRYSAHLIEPVENAGDVPKCELLVVAKAVITDSDIENHSSRRLRGFPYYRELCSPPHSL